MSMMDPDSGTTPNDQISDSVDSFEKYRGDCAATSKKERVPVTAISWSNTYFQILSCVGGFVFGVWAIKSYQVAVTANEIASQAQAYNVIVNQQNQINNNAANQAANEQAALSNRLMLLSICYSVAQSQEENAGIIIPRRFQIDCAAVISAVPILELASSASISIPTESSQQVSCPAVLNKCNSSASIPHNLPGQSASTTSPMTSAYSGPLPLQPTSGTDPFLANRSVALTTLDSSYRASKSLTTTMFTSEAASVTTPYPTTSLSDSWNDEHNGTRLPDHNPPTSEPGRVGSFIIGIVAGVIALLAVSWLIYHYWARRIIMHIGWRTHHNGTYERIGPRRDTSVVEPQYRGSANSDELQPNIEESSKPKAMRKTLRNMRFRIL